MDDQYRERTHLLGKTEYIPDMDVPSGTLIGHVVTAPYAHARLLAYSIENALQTEGVFAIVGAKDIPGINQMGIVEQDEPCLLPIGECNGYMGQAVLLIAAKTKEAALKAERKIEWQWEELPAVLTVEEAFEKKSFVCQNKHFVKGEWQKAMQEAPHTLQGTVEIGGQEHFYFETHSAFAQKQGQGNYYVRSSTQNPTDTQRIVAQILSISNAQVDIEAGCLGGGFGGKQSQGAWAAAWAALLAYMTDKPVRLILNREEDMHISGKRHGVLATWQIGFTTLGEILSYKANFLFDCGWCADVSEAVICHGLFHSDSAYYIPAVCIDIFGCKTNKTSSTAYRGFGVPQTVAVLENAIEQMGTYLKKDAATIRMKNYYGIKTRNTTFYNMKVNDNILRSTHRQICKDSNYYRLQKQVCKFNKEHEFIKQGVSLIPCKFGISFNEDFLNQAGALINIYKDGTLLIHHSGTEMGQGLNDKMRLVVHNELGVPVQNIRVNQTKTSVIPNTTSTAASTGADFNGGALADACQKFKKRIKPLVLSMMGLTKGELVWEDNLIKCGAHSIPFNELVINAYNKRHSLSEKGYYSRDIISYDFKQQQGRPYWYFVMGMAVVHVEVNLLTGVYTMKEVWILHDCGKSIDESIDRGQIHGAFIQGVGWCTMEKIITSTQGKLLTDNLDNYKLPGIYELPEKFHCSLIPNNPEHHNIQNSRAVGEPPLLYALGVWLALQKATEKALPFPAVRESLLKPFS